MPSGRSLLLFLGRHGGGPQLFNYLENFNREAMSISVGPSRNRSSKYTHQTNWHKSAISIPLVAIYASYFIIKERNKIDRIVVTMSSWADILPSIVSLLLKKQVSRIIHDFKVHPGDSKLQVVPLRIQLLLSTDFLTLSEYVANLLDGVTKKQIINAGMFFPNCQEIECRRTVSQVIFFGRISNYKGADMLLESLNSLKQKINLVIAGQGAIPLALSEKATLTINRFLEESELSRLISESDVAVFPYTEGSQSGAMAFAASYGCKIVATNVGGISEFGSNSVGFWFSNPDSEAFAAALECALESNERPMITNDMRERFVAKIGLK